MNTNPCRQFIHCLLPALLLSACTSAPQTEEDITMTSVDPPAAEKIPHELTEHGNKRSDPYFWLREREDTRVRDYLEAENAYTESMLEDYRDFREKLYDEMRARIKEEDISVPYFENDYFYYTRFEKGDEHPRYLRCRKLPAEEEMLLLNVNELARGKSYCEEGNLDVSPDNQWLAYSADFQGRRKYQVFFRELSTGKTVDDNIKNTTGNVTWCKDNKTVFYTVEDENTLRSYRIMRHVVGQPAEKDVIVYEEKDETFSVEVYASKSGNTIFIVSYSTLTTETLFLDAHQPTGKFRVVLPREKNHEYSVDEMNGKFYIRTNWKAKNFRLMETTATECADKNKWKELVAHEPGVLFESFEIFNDYLVVERREKGLKNLYIRNFKTGDTRNVKMDEEDYLLTIGTNEDPALPYLRVVYTSLKTPASVYDIDLQSLEKTLKKQTEIPGGYDASLYETRRLYAKSRDGKDVPVSLIYRKDKFKKGENPLLVYGYGSYGVNIDPTFSSTRLSLLDRGFVFAIAHVRGSQTLGREWYEDGKMLHKKNTFNDFIDCTEFLVREKYADKNKVFAMGGSAGGLLMGAVANMRPDLYKGMIAQVPFVDVISTMMDTSIPLTTGEFDEWGNPADKTYYDYMLSYSPYDNVEKKEYPAMLVTTGLHDSQVQYWEPAKWVARLRDMKTDKHMLLLRTNMDAGHGGASGRFEYLKEVALEDVFMFKLLGIKE